MSTLPRKDTGRMLRTNPQELAQRWPRGACCGADREACDRNCAEPFEQKRWGGKNWMERTTCERAKKEATRYMLYRALHMRTASGGGSGSAVRREESIPSMGVKWLSREKQKHCRISPCPELLLWRSPTRLKAVSMNILTTMSSNASLRRLRSCKKKVKSCPLQHRFNPSASFASESGLNARSHRSCELATWCPRPFSLMSSCLHCAFLFFGDSIFWRGFCTWVLGSPRRSQDCARDVATFANAALVGPRCTCQLR